MKKLSIIIVMFISVISNQTWSMLRKSVSFTAPKATVTNRFGGRLATGSKGLFMPFAQENNVYNLAVRDALLTMRTQGFIEPHTIRTIDSLRHRVSPELYENFVREVEQLRQQHEDDLARFTDEGGAQQRFEHPKVSEGNRFGVGTAVAAVGTGAAIAYGTSQLVSQHPEEKTAIQEREHRAQQAHIVEQIREEVSPEDSLERYQDAINRRRIELGL